MSLVDATGQPGRTFVGFGFGAIQAGLFLYEAQQSGAFTRLVARLRSTIRPWKRIE